MENLILNEFDNVIFDRDIAPLYPTLAVHETERFSFIKNSLPHPFEKELLASGIHPDLINEINFPVYADSEELVDAIVPSRDYITKRDGSQYPRAFEVKRFSDTDGGYGINTLSPTGEIRLSQVKPRNPIPGKDGKNQKYVSPTGSQNTLIRIPSLPEWLTGNQSAHNWYLQQRNAKKALGFSVEELEQLWTAF
ncbi:MAG: hypothetical protein KME38_28825 [Spirirestis rafaelensis WJT71-NPBG6]|nr:hypothetical protein [Spirirestis rafaelensis WJT71-NPBG6]